MQRSTDLKHHHGGGRRKQTHTHTDTLASETSTSHMNAGNEASLDSRLDQKNRCDCTWMIIMRMRVAWWWCWWCWGGGDANFLECRRFTSVLAAEFACADCVQRTHTHTDAQHARAGCIRHEKRKINVEGKRGEASCLCCGRMGPGDTESGSSERESGDHEVTETLSHEKTA